VKKGARRNPQAVTSSWIRPDAIPAIRQRIEEKVKTSACYAVRPNDTFSLLRVGSCGGSEVLFPTARTTYASAPERRTLPRSLSAPPCGLQEHFRLGGYQAIDGAQQTIVAFMA
jgi:hypothetical protein